VNSAPAAGSHRAVVDKSDGPAELSPSPAAIVGGSKSTSAVVQSVLEPATAPSSSDRPLSNGAAPAEASAPTSASSAEVVAVAEMGSQSRPFAMEVSTRDAKPAAELVTMQSDATAMDNDDATEPSAAPEPSAATKQDDSAIRTTAPTPPVALRIQCLDAKLIERWEAEQQFTPSQEEAMAALRNRLIEHSLLTEWWDSKPVFYRFCQARQYDVDKAFAMFTDHMQWRKEWKLDELTCGEFGEISKFLEEFKFPQRGAVKAAYSYVHHKTDKQGRLIYIDRAGALDFDRLNKSTDREGLLKSYVWDCEVA